MPAGSRESAFRLNGSNGPTEEARCSLSNYVFFVFTCTIIQTASCVFWLQRDLFPGQAG